MPTTKRVSAQNDSVIASIPIPSFKQAAITGSRHGLKSCESDGGRFSTDLPDKAIPESARYPWRRVLVEKEQPSENFALWTGRRKSKSLNWCWNFLRGRAYPSTK
jgi:hypothetical protein